MNGYLAYYGDKKIEVYASTSYEAQQKAIEILKPPKSKKHLVTVYLCEKYTAADKYCPCGECGLNPAKWSASCKQEAYSQVVHSTASIG